MMPMNQAGAPGYDSVSGTPHDAYLGGRLCSHQSSTAQTIRLVGSSGASPSWHAHLCQSGMQVLFQAHTPVQGQCGNWRIQQTPGLMKQTSQGLSVLLQLSCQKGFVNRASVLSEYCKGTCTHHSAPAQVCGRFLQTMPSCMQEITSSHAVCVDLLWTSS